MLRHGGLVQARLDKAVHDNVLRTCVVAGVTFFAFFVMHLTPLGSRMPSQIFGNLVGGIGVLGFAAYARGRKTPLSHPNAALAGVFVWVLLADMFLTWTEHSTVSLNVGLFVMLLGGALLLSWPALFVTLAAAAVEGLFVASLVPGGHIPTQVALEGAAAMLAVLIHANRVGTHRRLEELVEEEEARRKLVEGAMRDVTTSEERLRRLAEASSEGIAVVEDGRIVDANPAFVRMFGAPLDALRGKSPFDLTRADDRDAVAARLADTSAPPWEGTGVRADGTTFSIALTSRELPYDGRTVRAIAVRDLTERERVARAEQETRVARRIVRRALLADAAGDPQVLAQRRRLGRSIAVEAGATSVERGLATFASMGLGELWLVARDGSKWTFAGHDLLDLDPGARMPSCALALGYIEGLLAHLEGQDMMGAELACMSQGHPECRFVALAKAQPVERGVGERVVMGSVGSRSMPSPTVTMPGSLRPPSGPP